MGPSKGTGGAKRRGLAEGCGSEEGCEREVRVILVEESKSWATSCEAVQRFLPSINKRLVNTFLIIGSEVLETLLPSQLNSDSSNLKREEGTYSLAPIRPGKKILSSPPIPSTSTSS